MSYVHSAISFPPLSVGLPVFLQAPWPYSGTATYGGQAAPSYTSGR